MTIQVQAPDGSIAEFPDGTPPETMTAAMRQRFGGPEAAPQASSPTAASTVATPPGVPRLTVTPPIEIQGPMPPAPSATQTNFQGAGSGLAHIVGMPVDLATGLTNAGIATINAISSHLPKDYQTNIKPVSDVLGGSQSIKDKFTRNYDAGQRGDFVPPSTMPFDILPLLGQVAGQIGGRNADYHEMSWPQKLGYNVADFLTQSAATVPALIARAPALAEAVTTGAKPGGPISRVFDTLSRPYADAPAVTAAGDALASVGAGSGVTVAKDQAPHSPLAEMLGAFGGGSAGGLLAALASGVKNAVQASFMRRSDTNVPLNPANNAPFTHAETERAARVVQHPFEDPKSVATTIRQNAAEFTAPSRPGETPLTTDQIPTSGLLSREPALIGAEYNGARVNKDLAPKFIQRDQAVKDAATGNVNSLRDPEADLGAPRAVAQQQADDTRDLAQTFTQNEARYAEAHSAAGIAAAREAATRAVATAQADVEAGITGAQSRLTAAQQSLRDVEAEATRQGAPFTPIANSDSKANASRNLDRTVVDEGYIPARTEKNRQFDEAPGRHDQLPADEVIAAARAVQRGINDLIPGDVQMPTAFVRRLQALAPHIVDGENVGGPGTALGGDLADLRKYLGTAHETAQRSGNFDLADNIGRLRTAINRTLEDAPGYAEANANYGQFADRFRPSPNDESAKFTRQIDRDPGRGNTPPSDTARRFLSSPEKAQVLQRMMDGSADGVNAVRDYLRSDFGMSALNPNGTINPNRAAAWGRNNADVLAQFPQVRQEFDGMIATARRGDELSAIAQANIETATRNLRDTERTGSQTLAETERNTSRDVRNVEREGARTVSDTERSNAQYMQRTEQDISRSAAGTLLREDPRDVAQRLLSTKKYGAEKEVDEINGLLGGDAEAKRGWKAAISEVLADRVSGMSKTGETYAVQRGRLAKEFKDNEDVLVKVYDPEEMNTLRQGHKLLEYFDEANKKATIGSNTADKLEIPSSWQLVVRHIYGDLRGGGIIKRFKLLLGTLPSSRQNAQEVANMAWFNPDTMAYLLERPVRNNEGAPFNTKLRTYEALAAGSRDSDQ